MIRPAATALTTRLTPTVPSSSSTRTSTKTAECVPSVYCDCLRQLGTDRGLLLDASACRRRASPRRSRRAAAGSALQADRAVGEDHVRRRCASASGEPSTLPGELEELSRAPGRRRPSPPSRREETVHEPPSIGDSGSDESPSLNVTSSIGRPERLGGDLGHDGVGAGADVGGGAADDELAVGAERGLGARPVPAWRPRRRWPCPSRSGACRRASSAARGRASTSRTARRPAR